MDNLWTILWVLWGLAFAVIEGVAIYYDHKDSGTRTLSDHLQNWFNTKRSKKGRMTWLVISGIFFAWFTTHIATGLI